MTAISRSDDATGPQRAQFRTEAGTHLDRFTRDLHERIISRLSAAGLELTSLATARDERPRRQLLECVDLVDETISRVRRIASDAAA